MSKKQKPDTAHRLTDRELAALEKRIAAEYKKAAEELKSKIDAYFEKLKKRDAEQAERLRKGLMRPYGTVLRNA